MGIIILAVLAFGIFSILRAAFKFIQARMKAGGGAVSSAVAACCKPLLSSTKETAQSAASNEPDWAAYDIPAFIRRGISWPVLTEKKKKRVRKAKAASSRPAFQLETQLAVF